MNKTGMFVLMALIVAALAVMSVSAAVTECLSPYVYNDTGVPTNVSAGNVCINLTDYDVNPTVAVKCGTWYACVAGACSVQDYYVGYSGNGNATCVATGWVSTGAPGSVALDTIINVTANASSCTASSTPVLAYSACTNAYTRSGTNGLCDGAGAVNAVGTSLTNVSAGNVCIGGADTQPTVGVKCGTWYACIAGACSIQDYYVGFAGTGAATCVATDWVSTGTPGIVAQNTKITATANASSCTSSSVAALTYSTCTNAYTRTGTDSLCDGAGAVNVNSTHVTAGNVCVAGANAQPNSSQNCGTWSDCVVDAKTASEYYVGYESSGTACSATDWVSAGSTVTYTGAKHVTVTEKVDACQTTGYGATYDKTDFKYIVVDGMGTAGAETVQWIDLLVLIFVIGFVIGVFVKTAALFK